MSEDEGGPRIPSQDEVNERYFAARRADIAESGEPHPAFDVRADWESRRGSAQAIGARFDERVPDARASTTLKIVNLADVTPRPIVPIWPGVLYRGKVTMMAGTPGDGKSVATTDVVARASVGGSWPCGTGRFEPMRTLMLSAEDDPGDTIRPRLEVAGADLDGVELIQGAYRVGDDGQRILDMVSLLQDLPLIETRLAVTGAGLFTVDPLTSFSSGSDTNKTSDSRLLLDSLAQMAARSSVCVLVVTHLNKRSDARRAMQMVAGSHVIVAAVRVALVTARDPNDRNRRLLLPVKLNIDREDGGFAYRVESAEHATVGSVPRVAWEPGRVRDISADDALIDSTPRAQAAVEKSNEVQDWLRDLLRHEPVAASRLWAGAKEKGYSERRVRTALKAIKAAGEPAGFRGAWHYRLPAESDTKP